MTPVSTRIVIADDDPMMAKVMRVIFEDEGFQTVTVQRGSQVFDELRDYDAQLVILDVNLPDINGFSLCGELRARSYYGPIIFLTGRDQIADKLEGFRIGADDYVIKPFEPLELVARAQVVMRRFQQSQQQLLGTLLRVDDAELSIGELSYRSSTVPMTVLTPTEMRILECLMRNARIVISRDMLNERIWGYDFIGDTNRVDVYIRRVRRKIELDPTRPTYLHTIRGLGYVFRPEPVLNLAEPLSPDEFADTEPTHAGPAPALPTHV
jgi:two-component system, OmpR family, response regulator RegX3